VTLAYRPRGTPGTRRKPVVAFEDLKFERASIHGDDLWRSRGEAVCQLWKARDGFKAFLADAAAVVHSEGGPQPHLSSTGEISVVRPFNRRRRRFGRS
jgi:hypothetical protein